MYHCVQPPMILKMILMNYSNYYLMTSRIAYVILCQSLWACNTILSRSPFGDKRQLVGIVLSCLKKVSGIPDKCYGLTTVIFAGIRKVYLPYINVLWVFKVKCCIIIFKKRNRWREKFLSACWYKRKNKCIKSQMRRRIDK